MSTSSLFALALLDRQTDDSRALWDSVADTSAVFYQGYKSSGGALFRACVDTACDVSVESDENVVVVDAHDDTEDGTRPPVSTLHTPLLRPTFAQAGLGIRRTYSPSSDWTRPRPMS